MTGSTVVLPRQHKLIEVTLIPISDVSRVSTIGFVGRGDGQPKGVRDGSFGWLCGRFETRCKIVAEAEFSFSKALSSLG